MLSKARFSERGLVGDAAAHLAVAQRRPRRRFPAQAFAWEAGQMAAAEAAWRSFDARGLCIVRREQTGYVKAARWYCGGAAKRQAAEEREAAAVREAEDTKTAASELAVATLKRATEEKIRAQKEGTYCPIAAFRLAMQQQREDKMQQLKLELAALEASQLVQTQKPVTEALVKKAEGLGKTKASFSEGCGHVNFYKYGDAGTACCEACGRARTVPLLPQQVGVGSSLVNSETSGSSGSELSLSGGTVTGSTVTLSSGSATVDGGCVLTDSPISISGAGSSGTISGVELQSDGSTVPLTIGVAR